MAWQKKSRPKPRHRRRRASGRYLLAFPLLVLLISFLGKLLVVESFYIPSSSMEPTLQVNDRIVVSKIHREIERGDIIVFRDPDGWLGAMETGAPSWVSHILSPSAGKPTLVKRVIGLPGDRVECCDEEGRVLVNGKPLKETYLKTNPYSPLTFAVRVPPDSYWVMGDNRSNSLDSRFHRGDRYDGFVPDSKVVGKVWFQF